MSDDDYLEDLNTLCLDLCLCGRDPESDEVREELRRALAFSIYYRLEVTGCLSDVDKSIGQISLDLTSEAAVELERVVAEMERLDGIDPGFGPEPKPGASLTRLN